MTKISDTKFRYRIRIRPLDYYFFGGEQTFGSGVSANYYAKTQAIPQQTSIVGMLRHIGYENLGKNKIGQSFDASNPKEGNDFGFLKEISPLYFHGEKKLKNGKSLSETDYAYGPFGQEAGVPFPVQEVEEVKYWNTKSFAAGYQAEGYTEKEGWSQHLIANKESIAERKLEASDVIETFTNIGIKKRPDGSKQDRQDGFFKQDLAKLQTNWEFRVLANFSEKEEHQLTETSFIMPFGAQKALCSVKIEKLDTLTEMSFNDLFPSKLWAHQYPSTLQCYLLTSDAWIPESISPYCAFEITDSKDFRNVRTPTGNAVNLARMQKYKDWGIVGKGSAPTDQLYKSQKYNLLKRGSLLYFDSEQQRKIDSLLNQVAFQGIGYNYYAECPRKTV